MTDKSRAALGKADLDPLGLLHTPDSVHCSHRAESFPAVDDGINRLFFCLNITPQLTLLLVRNKDNFFSCDCLLVKMQMPLRRQLIQTIISY